jgi:hypothetical protein
VMVLFIGIKRQDRGSVRPAPAEAA